MIIGLRLIRPFHFPKLGVFLQPEGEMIDTMTTIAQTQSTIQMKNIETFQSACESVRSSESARDVIGVESLEQLEPIPTAADPDPLVGPRAAVEAPHFAVNIRRRGKPRFPYAWFPREHSLISGTPMLRR
jgi:hypothetical protein